DGLDHRRRELLGREPVAAADHRAWRAGPVMAPVTGTGAMTGPARLVQGRDHVLVKRLADGAGLLGAVKHGEGPGGGRQGGDEVRHREGAIEPDAEDADLFALPGEPLDCLAGGFDT